MTINTIPVMTEPIITPVVLDGSVSSVTTATLMPGNKGNHEVSIDFHLADGQSCNRETEEAT